jgi:CBS-domain-containing membrane protein
MFRCRPPRQDLEFRELLPEECLHYRDLFREARYAALADAEGFGAICFALESLGLRLLGEQATLERYKRRIADRALKSLVLAELATSHPTRFKSFEALYKVVQSARNDAMHIGAYARHATEAAIELCIGLEEALMADVERTVGSVMVTSPMTVEKWQPVAHARQLMLMHSFSFLPVHIGESWWLVSELGLAKFLGVNGETKKARLGQSVERAKAVGMEMVAVGNHDLLRANMTIDSVLQRAQVQRGPMLWLVVDGAHPDHLAGVLSPFELM